MFNGHRFLVVLYTSKQVSSIVGLSSLDQVLLLSDNHDPNSNNNNNNNNQQQNIIILYWTKFFEVNDFEVGIGRTPFIKAQCPPVKQQSTCWTTTDRGLLNRSHAIIFHARDLDPDDLPPPGWRRPHQNFIFFNYESPVHTDLAKLRLYFNNYFNRTMTYRHDSDVVSLHPYGRLKCRKKKATDRCLNFPRFYSFESDSVSSPAASGGGGEENDVIPRMDLTRKTRTAAWFVSNCVTDSRRESLVHNLSLFIPVDIYGECHGGQQCRNRPECDRMLSRHYRFYLSFENSLCPDYVTEKLYRALAHDTVPVVFGGADYSNYLPAGSYLDARDFESPQILADHIKKLMSDDQLYMKHFNWRRNYVVDPAPLDGWCHLCRLLSDHSNSSRKTYADIAAWWSGKETNQSCIPPPASLVSADDPNNTPDAPYVSADYVRKLVNKLRQIVSS
jgi:alpha-1,3-fucosyltransferase